MQLEFEVSELIHRISKPLKHIPPNFVSIQKPNQLGNQILMRKKVFFDRPSHKILAEKKFRCIFYNEA